VRIRARVWLEDESGYLFGDGTAALLQAVRRTGSIRAAASSLGMSYRQAWGKIRALEDRLGFRILSTRTGGWRGGGSRLTAAGERLLDGFLELRRRLDRQIEQDFGRSELRADSNG